MRRWLCLIATLGIAFAATCIRSSPQVNLVIIGIDTLRRDHLGCYGYSRQTSPNIDTLASHGVVFEDAVSVAPWTLPSFATVFTSLYPSQHRAGVHERSSKSHSVGAFGNPLRSDVHTLAEVLAMRGYQTCAFINGATLSREFKVNRGFGEYLVPPNWRERDAIETTEQALAWIDSHKNKPFFLFVHYFDPHVPYKPPPPFDMIFDPSYEGRIERGFDRQRYLEMKSWLSNTDDPEVRAAWKHIVALYDGEIAFTDSAVGMLLSGLKQFKLNDKTLIVLLSDHGEEFLDHDGFEHGHTLYDELIKVPLIFSLPGRLPEGIRIEEQVRLVDVMPTVLEVLRISNSGRMEGVSLLGLMRGEGVEEARAATLPRDFAYAECVLYGTEKKALVTYPWKIIFDVELSKVECFNLESDPSEKAPIVTTKNRVLDLMEDALFGTIFATSPCWNIEIGGVGHRFDLSLRLRGIGRSGDFTLWCLFDSSGHVLDDQVMVHKLRQDRDAVLTLSDFAPEGVVKLCVLSDPFDSQCEFDVEIDGKRSGERIFIGKGLRHPAKIPFSFTMSTATAEGKPARCPEEPYILIWHTPLGAGSREPTAIGEKTRAKLKALGYIQ